MGYRIVLATIEKDVVDNMRTLSYRDFVDGPLNGDEEKYYPVRDFPTYKNVFELGKYIESEVITRIVQKDEKGRRIPFFMDQEVNKDYTNEDNELYLTGKEGLLALIEVYREKIIASYRSQLEFTFRDSLEYKNGADLEFKQHCFLLGRLDTWDSKYMDYLDLDEERKHNLSHFWDYEYLIFNLIHLLNTIDFSKYELVLYGS